MKGIGPILIVSLLGLAVGLAAWNGVLVATPAQAQQLFQRQPELTEILTEPLEPEGKPGEEFPVPFAPLPKTITPCRACHGPEKDFPISHNRREPLLIHTTIKLNHGGVRVWCLDCHHPEQRDYLIPLSDGKLIPFDRSYLLCGKCHGTKFRDWRYGIHGKRTGFWNGTKTYYLCVNCHNPHSPRFKPLEPMPPPHKPWTPKETAASEGGWKP